MRRSTAWNEYDWFDGGLNDHKSRMGCKRKCVDVLKVGLVIQMILDGSFVEVGGGGGGGGVEMGSYGIFGYDGALALGFGRRQRTGICRGLGSRQKCEGQAWVDGIVRRVRVLDDVVVAVV